MTKDKAESHRRSCFVIGPIGKEGTEVRLDADWLFETIISPVLTNPPFNYNVMRADKMPPGTISFQIISAILDSDLVIADLTHHNANAFYELAIAHVAGKKTIHIVKHGHEDLPFDVHDIRTIFYSRQHPQDLEKAKKNLSDQTRSVELANYKPLSPISNAKALRTAMSSSISSEQAMTAVIRMLSDLSGRIVTLEQTLSQPRPTLAEVLMSPRHTVPFDTSSDAFTLGKLIQPAQAPGALSNYAATHPPINMPQPLAGLALAELLSNPSGDAGTDPNHPADQRTVGKSDKAKDGSERG